MKFFITAFLFSLVNANASNLLGGVDVGSGTKPFIVGINTPHFSDEEQIKSHVQKLLPQIKAGSLPKIKQYIEQGNCSEHKVVFKGVEAIRVYDFDSRSAKFGKKETGHLAISLFNCKSPKMIKADVRPIEGELL